MATLCLRFRQCGTQLLVPKRCRDLKNCLSKAVLKYNVLLDINQQSKPSFKVENSLKSVVAPFINLRYYGDVKQNKNKPAIKKDDDKKLSIFQRFKKMYKEYWYVLVPVHIVTSIGWFGGFYYMAISGVDIVPLLETFHVSQTIIDSMKDSHMGYFAIAYACYKIATPVRYTVTLGGTTISINYLTKWGYIKPVPSPGQIKAYYKEHKEQIWEQVLETKHDIKEKADKIKGNLDDKLEKGIHKFEEKLRDKKEQIKKKTSIFKDIKNEK